MKMNEIGSRGGAHPRPPRLDPPMRINPLPDLGAPKRGRETLNR